jgi:hypothetical protein
MTRVPPFLKLIIRILGNTVTPNERLSNYNPVSPTLKLDYYYYYYGF